MTRPWRIAVPGKLFLSGEYAVLEGASAVVLAVDRHVFVEPGESDPAGLVARSRAAARDVLGRAVEPAGARADSTALQADGRKLGLGSSAAVAVGAVASAFLEAGRDLEDGPTRREMWAVARDVHDAHQGTPGSGADLAACLHGGFVAFRRGAPGSAPEVRPWTLPTGLHLRFAWSGAEASTPAFLGAVRAWRGRDPAGYEHAMAALGDGAERLAGADPDDPGRFLEGVRRYGDALGELGRHAGVPVVPPASRALATWAARCGGAAKPSGAGGGDMVVAFLPGDGPGHRFDEVAASLGLVPVPLAPAARGVHVTTASGD